MLNLNDLEIGDSVRFVNGQVAKVVGVEDNGHLYFNKKVARDTDDLKCYYDTNWYYDQNGECTGCTNHIIEIIKKGESKMKVDLKTLKIGDSVRFKNGQVAKVVDIRNENYLYFNKKVAGDTNDAEDVYDSYWRYELNGEITGLTNHIIEIIKKGEENVEFE